jgi:hypothetical protein
MITVSIYQDTVNADGTITSGPLKERFTVWSIGAVKPELERRYGGIWQPCADGKDGMYENSQGEFGPCLVSICDEDTED